MGRSPALMVRLAVQLVSTAGLVLLAVAEPVAVPLCVATLFAAGPLIWWPAARARLPWLAAGAAVCSIALTLAQRWWGAFPLPAWGVLEVPVLSVLAALVVRWSPARLAALAGGLVAAAAGVTILRSDAPFTPVEAVYGMAFWALGPVAAATVAGYLRYQRTARGRAVDSARRAQRLELAGDLHDYVAHDVSEMIAQAQAAAVVAADDASVLGALRRIEAAGLNAMASMDRMVGMLHAESTEQRGVVDLPRLTERFAESSAAGVSLDVAPGLAERIPRELTSTVYRVVVEALTNVRRHAPDATRVDVAVEPAGDAVRVSVINNGSRLPAAEPRQRGGLGLPGLTERVEALAGTLQAGPHGDGWRVVATLPVSGAA